jgi:hypothetical protein
MLSRKIGWVIPPVLIVALGIFVNFKPASFPQEAEHTLDDFIQRFKGPGFSYKIISAERGTAKHLNDDPQSPPRVGTKRRDPGVCPDFDPSLEENWCVTIDRKVETPSGDRFTHFILQKQGQLWVIDGVPDSEAEVFQQLGCKW